MIDNTLSPIHTFILFIKFHHISNFSTCTTCSKLNIAPTAGQWQTFTTLPLLNWRPPSLLLIEMNRLTVMISLNWILMTYPIHHPHQQMLIRPLNWSLEIIQSIWIIELHWTLLNNRQDKDHAPIHHHAFPSDRGKEVTYYNPTIKEKLINGQRTFIIILHSSTSQNTSQLLNTLPLPEHTRIAVAVLPDDIREKCQLNQ